MRITLTPEELERLNRLTEIRDRNFDVLELYRDYLTEQPCFITKEAVDTLIRECDVSQTYAYFALLTAACGLETEKGGRDMQIARSYFLSSVQKLEAEAYRENAYYRHIKIPEVKVGSWELKYEAYQPYEAFVRDDIALEGHYREIPRLGFFSEGFSFPAVLENGNEWMTITPNEINSMHQAVETVTGRVVTFGLGLGYFAYMASEKKTVESVTVVERSKEVIRLFETYILPQFAHREKIRIVAMDAFAFARNCMPSTGVDYAFVDLWHDVSDGVPLYVKMKRLERLSPDTKYLYWMEESLLSNLRWRVFAGMMDEREAENSSDLPPVLKRKDISTYEEFAACLDGEYLKSLAALPEEEGFRL